MVTKSEMSGSEKSSSQQAVDCKSLSSVSLRLPDLDKGVYETKTR